MCASSKDNCVAILQQYNLQLKDVNVLLWKEEIIRHAKGIYSSLTPFQNSDSICFSPKEAVHVQCMVTLILITPLLSSL